MESMKAVDSLNPEQFADLASSLNNFFTKINNEQQQQQVPYSSVESNPSSSTTTSECSCEYINTTRFCQYDVWNFRRMFGSVFVCNARLKVPFKYFLVFPKTEPGDLGQSTGSGK